MIFPNIWLFTQWPCFHPLYRPRRPLGWAEAQFYSFLGPSTLYRGGRSAPRPGRLYLRKKTRYPLYRRLGGPHGRSGREENLVPTGIRSRNVQPVISRYTAWATQAYILTSSKTGEKLYFNSWGGGVNARKANYCTHGAIGKEKKTAPNRT
jgi:hypothetical protein